MPNGTAELQPRHRYPPDYLCPCALHVRAPRLASPGLRLLCISPMFLYRLRRDIACQRTRSYIVLHNLHAKAA
jgi:hypothetical protein